MWESVKVSFEFSDAEQEREKYFSRFHIKNSFKLFIRLKILSKKIPMHLRASSELPFFFHKIRRNQFSSGFKKQTMWIFSCMTYKSRERAQIQNNECVPKMYSKSLWISCCETEFIFHFGCVFWWNLSWSHNVDQKNLMFTETPRLNHAQSTMYSRSYFIVIKEQNRSNQNGHSKYLWRKKCGLRSIAAAIHSTINTSCRKW